MSDPKAGSDENTQIERSMRTHAYKQLDDNIDRVKFLLEMDHPVSTISACLHIPARTVRSWRKRTTRPVIGKPSYLSEDEDVLLEAFVRDGHESHNCRTLEQICIEV